MSAERPILIVDDDGVLRETLADQLAVDGEFRRFRRPLSARPKRSSRKRCALRCGDPDVGLPLMAMAAISAPGRKQGQKMPIIMLTGSDAETDVVRGLDSGANDYIAKSRSG